MRPFLRYPLEFCVCFIFVELIHKAQWFNFDYKSKPPSSQTTHLYQTGESVLKTDKEPYDASNMVETYLRFLNFEIPTSFDISSG